jgi:Holliday junction resolvase
MPMFDGAPDGWLASFDRFGVSDCYSVPDGEGLVHVVVSPEVRTVLREIKAMPGRRVGGARAEAFLHNPFAALGADAAIVLDPEDFERSREDAGLSFARFTVRILTNERDTPYYVALLVEETIGGEVQSKELPFNGPDDLAIFVRKLDDRLRNGSQICFWKGYDLEILGDTSDQLECLKRTLSAWESAAAVTYADIFDLSQYSDRIEGIGEEKPYYSPFVARKNEGDGWFPNNIDIGFLYTPGKDNKDSDAAITIVFDDQLKQHFRDELSKAKRENRESFAFPGCPKPIKTSDAKRILGTIDEAVGDIEAGTFKEPNKQNKKITRLGLVVKPNVETLDFMQERGLLSCPDTRPILPKALKAETMLLEHQQHGVAWLQYLWSESPKNSRGALLADDMGLGKTLQLLSFIANCLENDPSLDPVLVVAPVSLLENWQEEIEKFFHPGTLPVLTLYGETLARVRQPRHLIDEQLRTTGITSLLRTDWRGQARVVLTTYETLRDLEFSLARQKWAIMVCDEAQKIKNPNALVTRAAKKQNVRFKIACTGTPVENTLADMWCLFDYIQPGLLGALNDFGGKYRKPIEAKTEQEKLRVEELRTIISPQILRRQKQDVARELPRKVFVDDCKTLQISAYQRKLYAHAIGLFRQGSDVTPSLRNHLGLLQYLRRLCSDPRPVGQISSDNQPLTEIIDNSPKMGWLLRGLEEIRQQDEKAIIFCEFRDLQRSLQRCIAERFGFSPDVINGETSAVSSHSASRQKRIRAFQEQPGFSVIILSPLAVGFGVNIQAANHVIHFTRTWNPAKEDQATDRAYRIGQTKDVYVYCPVVTASDFKTFDAKLDELLDWKRGLSSDMLNGTGDVGSGDFGDLQDVDGSGAFEIDIITPEDVEAMSPEGFEAFCAVMWSKQGFTKVYRTPRSGDGGIDVVAISDNKGVLIQCKSSARSGQKLGWEAIKDVVTGTTAYARRHPGIAFSRVAATNQFFNDTAQAQARMNHVELIDRETFAELLRHSPVTRLEIEAILMASVN